MSESNSNRQKRLYAVAGVVFGASAVAAVMASYNIFLREDRSSSSSTLRGSSSLPNTNSGKDTSVDKGSQYQRSSNVTASSPSVSTYQVISQNSTSFTTHFSIDRNSNDVAELISSIEAATHLNAFVPAASSLDSTDIATTGEEMTAIPTYSPTLELPTFAPTQSNGAPPKMLLPMKRSNQNDFRLKLYWEEGYYWQENINERWWCLSCQEENCESGSKMELRDCTVKSDRDVTFNMVSFGIAGHQIRVTNTDLCLTKMGSGRAIKLKNCRKADKKQFSLQLFKGIDSNDKFDLRPSGYLDRCLSNHHHPKAKEIVYAETCKKAHRADTGYWVKY
jgi:hypothetical protein